MNYQTFRREHSHSWIPFMWYQKSTVLPFGYKLNFKFCRTRWAGARTTGASPSHSERRLCPSSFTSMTSTWYAGLIRWETFSIPSTRYIVVIPCHAFQKVTVMDLFAYPVQVLKNMFLLEIQRKNVYKIYHTSWKVQYLQNCVGIRFSDVLYFKLRQMERIPNTCFCYNTLSLNVESRFVRRYWTAQP